MSALKILVKVIAIWFFWTKSCSPTGNYTLLWNTVCVVFFNKIIIMIIKKEDFFFRIRTVNILYIYIYNKSVWLYLKRSSTHKNQSILLQTHMLLYFFMENTSKHLKNLHTAFLCNPRLVKFSCENSPKYKSLFNENILFSISQHMWEPMLLWQIWCQSCDLMCLSMNQLYKKCKNVRFQNNRGQLLSCIMLKGSYDDA